MDQPGEVANPARGQLNREYDYPCLALEDLASRARLGRPVPRTWGFGDLSRKVLRIIYDTVGFTYTTHMLHTVGVTPKSGTVDITR